VPAPHRHHAAVHGQLHVVAVVGSDPEFTPLARRVLFAPVHRHLDVALNSELASMSATTSDVSILRTVSAPIFFSTRLMAAMPLASTRLMSE
jgi:hypothetical protein